MKIASVGARAGSFIVAAALAGSVAFQSALALDEAANEKEQLKACEKQMCEMVTKKEGSGSDLACNLSKTWAKAKIQEGIEKRKLSWGFGDARCTFDVKVKRDAILGSVSKPDHSLEFDQHTVKCTIEREKEPVNINVTIQPKITFKDGKAQKVWINVKQIDAPTVVKGAIWTVAQAEDYFGVFHSDMVAEINELIGQKCPKVAAGN